MAAASNALLILALAVGACLAQDSLPAAEGTAELCHALSRIECLHLDSIAQSMDKVVSRHSGIVAQGCLLVGLSRAYESALYKRVDKQTRPDPQ